MKYLFPKFGHPGLGPRRTGFALVVALTAIVLITVIVLAFFSKALLNRQVSFTSTNQIKSDMLARTALDIIVGEVRQEIVDYSTAPTNGIYVPLASSNIIPIKTGVNAADTAVGVFTIAKIGATDTKINPGINGKSLGSTISLDTKSRNGRTLSQWFSSGPRLGTAALPTWTYLSRSGNVVTNGNASGNQIAETNYVTGRFSYTVYNTGGLLDANVAGFSTNAFPESRFKSSIAYADLTAVGLTTNQIQSLANWRNPSSASNAVLFDSWATGIPATNSPAAKQAAGPALYGYLTTSPGDRSFFSRRDLLRYFNSQGITSDAAANFTAFSRAVNSPSWGPKTPGGSSINYEQQANQASSFNRLLPGVTAYQGTMKFYQDDGNREEYDVTEADPLVPRRFSLAKLAWIGHNGRNDAAFNSTLSIADRDQAILDCFGLTWNGPAKRWEYSHGDNSTIFSLDDVRSRRRAPDFFELLRAGILSGSLGTNPGAAQLGSPTIASVGVMGNVLELANKKDRQILQIGANMIDQADRDNYPTVIYQFSNQEVSAEDFLYNCVFGVENLPTLSRVGVIDSFWPDHSPEPNTTVTGDLRVFLQPEVWNPHDSATADPAIYPETPSNLRFVVYGAASIMMDQAGQVGRQYGNSPAVMNFGLDPSVGNINRTITFINPPPSSASPPAFFDTPVAITGYCTSINGAAFNKPELEYIDYTKPQGADNRYKPGATPTTWDPTVDNSPYAAIYMGTLSRTVAPKAPTTVPPTPQTPRQHYVWVVPDLAMGGYLTFVLEYLDNNNVWRPYSMISRVQIIGQQGWGNGSPWGGSWASEFGHVDPRTDRFSVSHSEVRSGNNETWMKEHSVRSSFGVAAQNLIQWNNSSGGRGAYFAGAPITGFTHALTTKFLFDGWMQNLPSSDYRYRDLDTVTRPADAWRAELNNDTHGDGMPAYQYLTALDRQGLKTQFTISASGGYLRSSMNRRRPYILNRPFRSVGELGYVFRDQPFKSLDLWSQDSADAALLDLFAIADAPEVQAGRLNPNVATTSVLQSLMLGANKQANSSTTNLTTAEALAIAQAATSELAGTNGPATSAATLATRLGAPAYSAATGVAGNNTATDQPFRNKTYGESPIRAVSSTIDTRSWNLLIDVVAQTGRMAANAPLLENFIVEGERRYWLNVSIDRLTGQIIDSQLEPVYE